MKKVLYPLSITHNNAASFTHAMKLCRTTNSELVVAASLGEEGQDPDTVRQEWMNVHDEIGGLKGEYILNNANTDNDFFLHMNYRFASTNLVELVASELNNRRYDLVVFTLPHAPNLDAPLLVNSIKWVLENTEVPVLMIPENKGYRSPEKMVMASNFRLRADHETDITNAVAFANLYNANLHFLNISPTKEHGTFESRAFNNIMTHLREDARFSFSSDVGEPLFKSAVRSCDNEKVDLLIVVQQASKVSQVLFNESYINQLATVSKVPIYVIHSGHQVNFPVDGFNFN